jgi:SAM-dependent methyltransferase
MNHFCRHCASLLEHEVIDLGHQPPSNAYLTKEQLSLPELTYPLKVFVCTNCWLVQLPAHATANELFTADYAYFSSTSSSWCKHAKQYVERVIKRLSLDGQSFVVELASNDGYLLQYMKEKNIPCLGIEPTHATALVSLEKGIETIEEFFGVDLAEGLDKADLIIANNVLAHVPDINDFVSGIATLLKKSGQVSIEFPHLLELINGSQFDTIYHEHYSYLSLHFVKRIANRYGLEIIDVEELSTHGGSLRVWLAHKSRYPVTDAVRSILLREIMFGLESLDTYQGFQEKAEKIKYSLLDLLVSLKKQNKYTLGYGAAAKGNTLLNYAGIRQDLLPFVVDRSPGKIGKYMPGSHIPIVSPDEMSSKTPDALFVLPWNIISEIASEFPMYDLYTAIPDIKFWQVSN